MSTRRAVGLYGSLYRSFFQSATAYGFGLFVAIVGWFAAVVSVIATVWQVAEVHGGEFIAGEFVGFPVTSVRLQIVQSGIAPLAWSVIAATLGHFLMLASAHVGLSTTMVEDEVELDGEDDRPAPSAAPSGPVEVVPGPDGEITCPECGAEYRAGAVPEACAECGTALVQPRP